MTNHDMALRRAHRAGAELRDDLRRLGDRLATSPDLDDLTVQRLEGMAKRITRHVLTMQVLEDCTPEPEPAVEPEPVEAVSKQSPRCATEFLGGLTAYAAGRTLDPVDAPVDFAAGFHAAHAALQRRLGGELLENVKQLPPWPVAPEQVDELRERVGHLDAIAQALADAGLCADETGERSMVPDDAHAVELVVQLVRDVGHLETVGGENALLRAEIAALRARAVPEGWQPLELSRDDARVEHAPEGWIWECWTGARLIDGTAPTLEAACAAADAAMGVTRG